MGLGAMDGSRGCGVVICGRHLPSPAVHLEAATRIARPAITEPVSDLAVAGLNDEDLLQEVAQQTPALQAQYADDLRRVNEYIQDAKGIVLASPNDEEARRALAEAYQQKAMLFELALDRSLP
jgi:histidinol-phosphate/aromatic aminotransferase/cobyric acid decarboxylase-like protein